MQIQGDVKQIRLSDVRKHLCIQRCEEFPTAIFADSWSQTPILTSHHLSCWLLCSICPWQPRGFPVVTEAWLVQLRGTEKFYSMRQNLNLVQLEVKSGGQTCVSSHTYSQPPDSAAVHTLVGDQLRRANNPECLRPNSGQHLNSLLCVPPPSTPHSLSPKS